MHVKIISFTDRGFKLAEAISAAMPSHDTEIVTRGISPSAVCEEAFRYREALVFIGAMGIAVRSAAPYIKDKLTDPPLIVIDEAGRYVIPVLSGHVGGANSFALEIADAIGAEPVLTTATDVSGTFSVDLFAKENGLRIVNREGIAKVSASALKGKAVTMSIKDFPPKEHTDVIVTDQDADDPESHLRSLASIVLCPERYAVGIGCRRGKSFEDILSFARKVLAENGIDEPEIGAVATIGIKKDEPGLIRLSEYWRVPLITFDASVLARVPGEFSSSQRVLEAVGVDNVCERAAAAAAGRGYKLTVKKQASDGITIAVASR